MSQVILDSKPIIAELVGLFFIAILVTGLIVFTDIRIFDSYVGLGIEVCNPTNFERFCVEIRERLDLAPDAQIEIGNVYWELLMIQAIVIPLGFAGFRFLTIAIRRRRFTALRIFTVILWGLIPLIFFWFGTIDVFYYVARGIDIPDQLEWLNMVGIFEHTKQFGNDPLNVERSDLLITFALGVILIGMLFYVAVIMYNQSGLRGFV